MEFIVKTAKYRNVYTIINAYPHLMSFNICTNDAGNCVIFLESLEELMKFMEAAKHDLIITNTTVGKWRHKEDVPCITIYDDYVE